jgi:hypothetical protein
VSKILKIGKEPVTVWLHEGLTGKYFVSQVSGESELRLFVNGAKDSQIIYLPKEGYEALEEAGAQENSWVEISRTGRGEEAVWHALVVPNPNATKRTEQPRFETTGWGGAGGAKQQADTANKQTRRTATPPENDDVRAQRPEANLMASALLAAVEAAQIVQEQSGVSFSAGDMRAMANTMYMEACKQRAEENGNERAA